MDYAVQLLVTLLLFMYLGSWLDTRTGKAPLFVITGSILGVVVGMGTLYKRAMMDEAARKHHQQDKASSEDPDTKGNP